MRQLLSKLLAGGLSAAVILLWYPQFFPSDSVESWLIRGIVWTLSFELMLLAFGPFEEALWETRAGRALYRWLRHSVRGADETSARSQLRGRSLLAGAVLTVPLALLAFAPPQVAKDNESKAAPAVTHVTEVKRIVKVERAAATTAPAARAAGASGEGGERVTPNYEGDRASSRKITSRSTSGDSGSRRSNDDAAEDEKAAETPAESAPDVADTPATDAPTATDGAPAVTTDSGTGSSAPRVYVGA